MYVVWAAIVLTDPKWQINCCGVISSWTLLAADIDWIDLQVWIPVNISDNAAFLYAQNSVPGKVICVCNSLVYICYKLAIIMIAVLPVVSCCYKKPI